MNSEQLTDNPQYPISNRQSPPAVGRFLGAAVIFSVVVIVPFVLLLLVKLFAHLSRELCWMEQLTQPFTGDSLGE